MKVAINIVTWNSLKYLPDCLRSIYSQSYKDFSVLVVDNASADGTLDFVQKDFPQTQILRNFKNLGFSRAHNQGIELAKKSGVKYVLVVNPDIILEPNFLEEIVRVAELEDKAGSLGGKLYRLVCKDNEECSKTKIIDSAGLKIFRSRKAVDRGAGEEENRQYDARAEVFGISGALALYRLDALEDVRVKFSNEKTGINEVFDEDFFAYKEDVDLAWRLQLAGWKAVYSPTAVAYHHRLVGGEKESLLKKILSRRARSKFVNYLSYKNQLLLLTKNEYRENFFRDYLFIVWQEKKRFFYTLFFEPRNLRAIGKYFEQRHAAKLKRKIILSRARVGAGGIRRWFR